MSDIFNRAPAGTLHACDEPQYFTRSALANFEWICRQEQAELAQTEFPTAEDAGMVRGEMPRRGDCPLETPALCRADLLDALDAELLQAIADAGFELFPFAESLRVAALSSGGRV